MKSSARRSLLQELRDELMDVRDGDGSSIIKKVELTEDIYPGADRDVAPDLIVGYHAGYRASWETVLGKMPRPLIEDNLDRWSGTHLIDPDVVPGMLLANRKINVDSPSISDIAPSILGLFNIAKPSQMIGSQLF